MIFLLIKSLLVSLTISAISTPLVASFLYKKGLIEDPVEKQKKTGNATALTKIPRGGGIPIFLGILMVILLFLPLDKYILAILVASFLVLMVGVVDDLKDISPMLRLVTNIIAAGIIVFVGIKINFISNPFGGVFNFNNFEFIPTVITIFWIVWCMNIVGWSAGVEGQLPGFVSIAALFIGILSLKYANDIQVWPVIILAGAVSGAYLGFLPYNFFPQKIMPGYSGKSLAGFLLAILSILSGAKLATLIFLLGIPMLDGLFVIVKRILTGKLPYLADGNHLHHQLLRIGWSRQKIAIFYWIMSLFLGVISLFLNSQQKFYVFLGLIILFYGFLLKVYRRI